ncbi:hypothetical protein D5085_12700 [Ectothiorhodospiraceae bacterium BW-2]|nr:hypothetical protein D5085_12700 [Ectothiorhodospiraceae bacterium BW-2]
MKRSLILGLLLVSSWRVMAHGDHAANSYWANLWHTITTSHLLEVIVVAVVLALVAAGVGLRRMRLAKREPLDNNMKG